MSVSRVLERIEELFTLAPDPGGGANRPGFSEAEASATRLVVGWMESAGLEVGLDPCGNLWGLPPGDEGPLITSGSHVDTVPNGGRFDGPLGTVLAIEAVERLSGSFGVLVCAAEEGARFGAGTIGSRTLTGKLTDDDLSRMRDRDGVSALEARSTYLSALENLPRLHPSPLSRLAAHVEIHIEQRRWLEDRGASLGIATTVAGPTRYRLRFTGEVAHAGETPADQRRDALCAASETVLLAERLAQRYAPEVVATASTLNVHPNSLTSIPGEVELGVDIRGADSEGMAGLVEELLSGSREASRRRGVTFGSELLTAAEPVALDAAAVEAAESVCGRLGIPAERCVSFAGHDVQHLSEETPTGLLFVPSTNGVSHAPEEAVDQGDVESALETLAALLPELHTRKEEQK